MAETAQSDTSEGYEGAMARNPRPIDPREGPLQSFAYDLRLLREKAGDPTYRAMAVGAGFSATTLSEAAGGVRKPSLDVTLAFVAVCGGESGEWRERWAELDRMLAAPAPDPGAGGVADSVGGAGSAARADSADSAARAVRLGLEPWARGGIRAPGAGADPGADAADATDAADAAGPAPARWTRARRVLSTRRAVLSGTAAALLVVGALTVPHWRHEAAGPVTVYASAAGSVTQLCPREPAGKAAFVGRTYQEGTNERVGASLDAPVVDNIRAGCTLRFSGYCVGESLPDQQAGTPDMRWFKLLDGSGVVSSSVIHGNPPENLPPIRCADDVPLPASVTVHVSAARTADTDILQTSGIDAPIVGLAAYYGQQQGAVAAAPQWHQLSISVAVPGGIQWTLTGVHAATGEPPGVPAGTVPLVAVACLGGEAPIGLADAVAIRPGDPGDPAAVVLTAKDLSAAEEMACQYPVVPN